MINTTEDHKPKDPGFYQKVEDAFNSCNFNELARLGFIELGMDPTAWKFLSDLSAGDRRESEKSFLVKRNLCITGFEKYNKPIRLDYVPDTPEERDWNDVKKSSALVDSLKTAQFNLRYNAAKKALEERNLPTVHIDVAKRYLDSRTSNPELFHNFKLYWRGHGHESQNYLLTSNILLASTAATFTSLAAGAYFQSQLTGEIAGAIQKTGGKCPALNEIRSGRPRTLSTPKIYKAGQCIEGVAQQQQFYGAVGHNVFWASASMAVGCAGMAVMGVSAMALFNRLSGSRKH